MRSRLAVTALVFAAALLAPASYVNAQQALPPAACASAVPGAGLGGGDSSAAGGPLRPALARVPARDTTHVAIRLLASATADEVRFIGSPRICVRLTGDAQLDSVHVLARRNIASPIVSGTTYRNVYVAVEILGRLNAECIAGRITGTAGADSTSSSRCASIGAEGRAGSAPR